VRGAGKVGGGRKSVARAFLEQLVSDETAAPALRLNAAIALDRINAREAEANRRDAACPFPQPEADL
jgi:hypothetical protein